MLANFDDANPAFNLPDDEFNPKLTDLRMKGKRLLALLWCCLFVMFGLSACTEDDGPSYPDVDSAAPELQLTKSIQTEPGRDVHVTGKVIDADGIARISLSCPGLYVEKTIDLLAVKEELLHEYDLDYLVRIDENEIGELYELTVEATDVGGRTTSDVVAISLNGDFSDPVFASVPSGTLAVIVKESDTSTTLPLSLRVTDNRGVDRIEISIPDINLTRTVSAGGMQDFSTTVDLDNITFTLPEGGSVTYEVLLTAYDQSGRTVEASFELSISGLTDFEEMYLADVMNERDLTSDILGVPMLCKHTDEYTYVAEYYNRTANTAICFIPQTTSFSPIMFGADPDDNTKLTYESPERIVLPEAGVYYRIEINTLQGTYSLSTFPTDEAIDPVPHAYGSISLDTWGDGGSWLQEFYFGLMFDNPKEINRFVQDETNPHLYRLEEPISFTAGDEVHFYIHNWHSDGWWDYCSWKVNKNYTSHDPSIFEYCGSHVNQAWLDAGNHTVGNDTHDWVTVPCPSTGSYTFEFDAYTGWGKFIPAN